MGRIGHSGTRGVYTYEKIYGALRIRSDCTVFEKV